MFFARGLQQSSDKMTMARILVIESFGVTFLVIGGLLILAWTAKANSTGQCEAAQVPMTAGYINSLCTDVPCSGQLSTRHLQ